MQKKEVNGIFVLPEELENEATFYWNGKTFNEECLEGKSQELFLYVSSWDGY